METKTEKDLLQDREIKSNAERITRNEQAIQRQTQALEQIRDHYYPPPEKWWRKATGFFGKILCLVVAYLGIAQAVDWLWNTRESQNLAEEYAEVGYRLFFEEGNASGALACYEKAVELDKGEPDYRTALSLMRGMWLGSDLFALDRPLTDAESERVNAAFTEATVLVRRYPQNPLPRVLLAQSLALRDETEAAIAAIERAVACAPENASVRLSACAIYFMCEKPAEARRALVEAERLDASLPLIGSWKGAFALLVDRDVAAARALFRACTERSPRLPIMHAWLGRALLAGEQPDRAAARAAFARALALDPRQKIALLGMADVCEREGKLELAKIWLDHALRADATSLSAYVARARVLGKTGDARAAVRDLTAALALAPLRADLYRLRADACEKAGDVAQAKSDRRAAAELGGEENERRP